MREPCFLGLEVVRILRKGAPKPYILNTQSNPGFPSLLRRRVSVHGPETSMKVGAPP